MVDARLSGVLPAHRIGLPYPADICFPRLDIGWDSFRPLFIYRTAGRYKLSVANTTRTGAAPRRSRELGAAKLNQSVVSDILDVIVVGQSFEQPLENIPQLESLEFPGVAPDVEDAAVGTHMIE